MAKSKTFRVTNNRMHFKCHNCNARRLVGVPPHVRRRTVTCHKCGERTNCALNRRITNREQQYGKVIITAVDGTELEVDLFNISLHGVGFMMPLQQRGKISVGKAVQFTCPWNPRLLSKGSYIIRSINGQRVGAERTQKY